MKGDIPFEIEVMSQETEATTRREFTVGRKDTPEEILGSEDESTK